MGTGIYRRRETYEADIPGVPCGYRDIPSKISKLKLSIARSLWVQGYTVVFSKLSTVVDAFPVGTGIYRYNEGNN